jgi:superfamily I DNA/RNA helicase
MNTLKNIESPYVFLVNISKGLNPRIVPIEDISFAVKKF